MCVYIYRCLYISINIYNIYITYIYILPNKSPYVTIYLFTASYVLLQSTETL